jgi:hypothetical protein
VNDDKKILSNLVKHFSQEDDPLTPLIDKYFMVRNQPKYKDKRIKSIELDLEDRDRTPGRLSPSSICGCERQAALKFLGIEGRKRIDPEAEAIFDDGNWRHHRWQTNFTDMAALFPKRIRTIAIEEPVRIDRFKVAGHLDVRIEIWWHDEWVPVIGDYKGANQMAYDYVTKQYRPKKEHARQLLSYMKAKKVRKGFVMYENKERQTYQIFWITMTKKLWAEVGEWCDSVLTQMDEKRLPPMHPDCNNGRFLYGKCQFKDLCFGNRSPSEIERMAYEGFDGTEAMWERFLLETEE